MRSISIVLLVLPAIACRGAAANAKAGMPDHEALAIGDDMEVAAAYWQHVAGARAGALDEASDLARTVAPDLDIVENRAYHQLCLLLTGRLDPATLGATGEDELQDASLLYGLARWHAEQGHPDEERRVLERIVQEAPPEALVMLSDILPTGFECGVLNGRVAPGSTVAIVGAGPIGLAALLTAQFYSPAQIVSIDLDDNRLEVGRSMGATAVVDGSGAEAAAEVRKLVGEQGADTVIEAVGIPATFELCQDIVAPGGTIANIGVHGAKVDLHLERLWSHNVTITTRLVDTVSTPMLLKTVQSGKLQPERLITHHFKLDKILDAYDAFGRAAATKALKVIVEA